MIFATPFLLNCPKATGHSPSCGSTCSTCTSWSATRQLAHCGYAPIEDAVAKIGREEVYHRLHSQGWVSRLGGATEESHRRMQTAVDQLWPQALGLFEPIESAPDYSATLPHLQATWLARVTPTLTQATLTIPNEVRARIRWPQRTAHRALEQSAQRFAASCTHRIIRSDLVTARLLLKRRDHVKLGSKILIRTRHDSFKA